MLGDKVGVSAWLDGQLIHTQFKETKVGVKQLLRNRCQPLFSKTSVVYPNLSFEFNPDVSLNKLLVNVHNTVKPYSTSVNLNLPHYS